MRVLPGVIFGIVLTIVLGAVAVYAYFATGAAPVATSAPPMPFEKTLANSALHARIRKEMPTQVPIAADENNLMAGAHTYAEHCAVCHSLPGKQQTAIAEGEFPKPPHLFKGKGVTDDPPGATYWRVSNGIRLTGMPAFEKTLSTTQIWQVSLLLANAHNLPPSVQMYLANASQSPLDTASTGTGAAGQAKESFQPK